MLRLIYEYIVIFLYLVTEHNGPLEFFQQNQFNLKSLNIHISNNKSNVFNNEQCSHLSISVVSDHQGMPDSLLLLSQLCCRRRMVLLLLDRTLFPSVLLQLLIQKLIWTCLSMCFLHTASLHPDLFSHHISVHSCEILLQRCAGWQLPLTMPGAPRVWTSLGQTVSFSLVLVIEIRLCKRLGLRNTSLLQGCRSLAAVVLDWSQQWDWG